MTKKLPPHKHSAGDIVESEDDYLLPQLRSARDPNKIEQAVIEEFASIGYVSAEIPIYDPTGFHDYRTEEGFNNYQEAVTFKLPAYAKAIYRLIEVAVMGYISLSAPATGELDIKIEYSVNEGADWIQFGDVIVVTATTWTEYTTTDEVITSFGDPLWVKFSYRVGQVGEGAVDGYLKECELRERYKRTQWEKVE